MTDIASIVQALEALKHAGEIVKALRAADAAYEKAELKLKIAELAEAVATARIAVLDAQEEIQNLKGALARTSEDARAALIVRENLYYFRGEGGESGPFCPRCFEAEGRKMPVTKLPPAFSAVAKYMCPQCKQNY